MTVEELLIALRSNGCEIEPRGRSTWRARCPVCEAPDSLRIWVGGVFDVLGLLCSRGCGRDRVLAALGLEDGR